MWLVHLERRMTLPLVSSLWMFVTALSWPAPRCDFVSSFRRGMPAGRLRPSSRSERCKRFRELRSEPELAGFDSLHEVPDSLGPWPSASGMTGRRAYASALTPTGQLSPVPPRPQ